MNDTIDGAQALVKTLEELGVECIFGYSGGAGGKLLEKVIQWCGSVDIYLHVASYNVDAIRFYKRHGFELTNTELQDDIAFKSGSTMPSVEMVRPKKGA